MRFQSRHTCANDLFGWQTGTGKQRKSLSCLREIKILDDASTVWVLWQIAPPPGQKNSPLSRILLGLNCNCTSTSSLLFPKCYHHINTNTKYIWNWIWNIIHHRENREGKTTTIHIDSMECRIQNSTIHLMFLARGRKPENLERTCRHEECMERHTERPQDRNWTHKQRLFHVRQHQM